MTGLFCGVTIRPITTSSSSSTEPSWLAVKVLSRLISVIMFGFCWGGGGFRMIFCSGTGCRCKLTGGPWGRNCCCCCSTGPWFWKFGLCWNCCCCCCWGGGRNCCCWVGFTGIGGRTGWLLGWTLRIKGGWFGLIGCLTFALGWTGGGLMTGCACGFGWKLAGWPAVGRR